LNNLYLQAARIHSVLALGESRSNAL
jgi:hypothetical protein